MLVISRKKNDSIVINDRIFVSVEEVQSNQVMLKVDCPECTIIQLDLNGAEIIRTENAPGISLSRKKYESFMIDRDVTITIIEIRDDRARLAVVAPKECPVHRGEVFEAIYGKRDNPVIRVIRPNDV